MPNANIVGGHDQARPTITEPLVYSGSLDGIQYMDLTPVIGREYTGLQIAQVLESEDRDRLVKDIATIGRSKILHTYIHTYILRKSKD
jgi:hypothetical protein